LYHKNKEKIMKIETLTEIVSRSEISDKTIKAFQLVGWIKTYGERDQEREKKKIKQKIIEEKLKEQ
jgi:hypothetical protein